MPNVSGSDFISQYFIARPSLTEVIECEAARP